MSDYEIELGLIVLTPVIVTLLYILGDGSGKPQSRPTVLLAFFLIGLLEYPVIQSLVNPSGITVNAKHLTLPDMWWRIK